MQVSEVRNGVARRTTSTDPRAQRLRARIKEGALRLVLSRPVDAITLNDLLAEAEVSRQGFYEHFAGRDDAILHAITDEFAEALRSEVVTGLPAREVLTMLTRLIDHRRGVYRNLRQSALFDSVVEQWRDLLLPQIRALVANDEGSDTELEATAVFVLGGVIELTRAWLRASDPVTSEEEAAVVWAQLANVRSLRP